MKQFIAIWGQGYTPDGMPSATVVGEDWFSEERGYDRKRVAGSLERGRKDGIDGLEVGQSIDLSDLSGTHIVVRVDDEERLMNQIPMDEEKYVIGSARER